MAAWRGFGVPGGAHLLCCVCVGQKRVARYPTVPSYWRTTATVMPCGGRGVRRARRDESSVFGGGSPFPCPLRFDTPLFTTPPHSPNSSAVPIPQLTTLAQRRAVNSGVPDRRARRALRDVATLLREWWGWYSAKQRVTVCCVQFNSFVVVAQAKRRRAIGVMRGVVADLLRSLVVCTSPPPSSPNNERARAAAW